MCDSTKYFVFGLAPDINLTVWFLGVFAEAPDGNPLNHETFEDQNGMKNPAQRDLNFYKIYFEYINKTSFINDPLG